MGCLNPDKKISAEGKKLLLALDGQDGLLRAELAEKAGFDMPVVARKMRQLIEMGLAKEDGKYFITDKGKEAAQMLKKEA